MGRRIVHDDVNVEVSWHTLLDGAEEPAELLARCRDMYLPIMVPAFTSYAARLDLPRAHGQQRLSAKSLDLRFSIDAEHQGPVWWVANDMQRECLPNAVHARETDRPEACAIDRVLQWVAAVGIVSSVAVTISVILSLPILRAAPGRGSSLSPSIRFV